MEINGRSLVTGVFGYPVSHSLSPVFQNAAFSHMGLNFVYVPFEVAPLDLGSALEAVRALNIRGINLTIPHKIETSKYLDGVSEESGILGVVNTVINENGRLLGDITDGKGFIRSITEDGGFEPEGARVMLMGAGGSSYAISGALVNRGIKSLFICNRTENNSLRLKKHLSEKIGFDKVHIIPFRDRNRFDFKGEVDLLVNTTSIGMKPGDLPVIDEDKIPGLRFVYDIVYNRVTELITASRKNRIPCLGGISMLVYQGAVSFELWTGKKAPVEVMKKSLPSIE